jgi:hypothetical protein
MPMGIIISTQPLFLMHLQFKFSYDKIDFYLAQSSLVHELSKRGHVQNGIYETISFGKAKVPFENFGFKGNYLKFQASNH